MLTPFQVISVDYKKYLFLAFFSTVALTHTLILDYNDSTNVARRIPGIVLFLALPNFMYMASNKCSKCVMSGLALAYHVLCILVGTYFLGMMINLLVKKGSDANPHFALTTSAPAACLANPSVCAVVPTCHANSDFFALATKYANDGLVFSTVAILNCVYGFPEALGLVLTWFNIVAFLALPWFLLVPFRRLRIVSSFFLYFFVGFDYLLAGNDQFIQTGYMPETLLPPLTATVVVFFLAMTVPDFLVFTVPWYKGVFFPSLCTCDKEREALMTIYGTAPVEPTAVEIVLEEPRRQKKQHITSRRG